jgi:hypothetical protein
MKPRKTSSPGIDHETILRDRDRASGKQYLCGCGGKVSCVRTTAFAETFWCDKCHDQVAVLLPVAKQPKLPAYYGDELAPQSASGEGAWKNADYGKDEQAEVFDL